MKSRKAVGKLRAWISIALAAAVICGNVGVFAENMTDTDDSLIIITDTTDSAAENESESTAETVDTITSDGVDDAENAAATETPAVSTETPAPTESAAEDTAVKSDKVVIYVSIDQRSNTAESEAVFELYDDNGTLLGTQSQNVDGSTQGLTYTFPVPQCDIGTQFKLKLVSGLNNVRYYDDIFYPGDTITFHTYMYEGEDGTVYKSEGISISAEPKFTKSVSLKYDGVALSLYPAPKLINGVTMVPARALANYIGFDVEYNKDYNVEIISLGSSKMYFNVDTAYTTVFGTDVYASAPTTIIDGTAYIALRTFADAIGSTLELSETSEGFDINMTSSPMVNQYFLSIPVNKWGISSSTEYMVWVSKSEYKVRVYHGKKYQWKQVYEAPCAIGAPSTPTITGSFEYQYTDRWNYNGYYVGPCLVFYGGYALHSVLLCYDGSEYDGRTGVMISHGCIRLKKKDIDWIYNTIPLKTRIYVTE